MSDREAVLANAKYLRNVRPIDPEEIADYVEGGIHPAVVRQILREAAHELGVVETEAGTFEPVSEEPIRTVIDRVAAFPAEHARVLEERLVGRYGPGWPEGDSGRSLREAIRRLKDAYYRQHPVEYDEVAALGYAIYHLPDYFAAIQYVCSELTAAGLLPRRLRILDVGAGVGGPALGLLALLPEDALVEYHAVEPSPAADVLEAMLEAAPATTSVTIHRERAETFEFEEGSFDLVVFANVLSELDEPAETAGRYLEAVAEDGSLVLLAPADRNTSIGLREVERSLSAAGATVYSPTVRLWPDVEPADRCWSFDVRPELAVPSFQRALDEAAEDSEHDPGEFVNVDVQYSYAILRRDDRRRHEFSLAEADVARMAGMDQHVTNRVDLLAVKLSRSLAAEEANPLYLIGDGSQQVDHYAVLTRRTALNRALAEAAYGDLLAFENALVLWNDDEAAYNVVVDDETVVDRVGP